MKQKIQDTAKLPG